MLYAKKNVYCAIMFGFHRSGHKCKHSIIGKIIRIYNQWVPTSFVCVRACMRRAYVHACVCVCFINYMGNQTLNCSCLLRC